MAQFSIVPLTSFGGDGWLAPSENPFLLSANNERGIAFSSTRNHLYLVSRTGGTSVRILDAITGNETGVLDVTGITGGTFALNKIAVGADGAIYGSNLRTGSTATQTFRVYRWADETSAPALIFDSLGLGNNTRLGDDFDAIGSGANTRLVAGYNQSGSNVVAGTNGYLVIDPTASAATPTTPAFNAVMFAGSPPPFPGDFRLGITFLEASGNTGVVLGTQGTVIGATAGATAPRLTSYVDNQGTLLASPQFSSTNTERILDFAEVGGTDLLATVDTTSNAVRIYDLTDPAVPVLLGSANATSGSPITNTNGAGDARWGAISGNTATLYAMNTNNGIQAFTVTVPEPGSTALLATAAASLAARRRRRSVA